MQSLKKLYCRWRYGRPLVVVSGLPRSGTSLVMQMVDAGGWPVLTDSLRQADADNPKGYYELEQVKELDKSGDKSWLYQHKGKAIKIVSHFLTHLPGDLNYKVIFILRDLDEVLMSQKKMLTRRGESGEADSAERMKTRFDWHLKRTRYILREQPNMDVLYLQYHEVVKNPLPATEQIRGFLGGVLELEAMRRVVDAQLYRNRSSEKPAKHA